MKIFTDKSDGDKISAEREEKFTKDVEVTEFFPKPDVIDKPTKNICPTCGRILK